MKYTSNPVAYSEIKQGKIYDEQFEAMAGVPTTRNLYFSVGGSEFIVDFQAELKTGQAANRTYKVHYDGTECEFKIGDQAKSFTFPSSGTGNTSISSMHNGGSCSVSWTGTTPWTGSGGVSGHTAWVSNSWDDSSYNAALAAAQSYAATVNGTVYSYTSASDKKSRTKSGWDASAAGSNPHISGTASNGQEYKAAAYDSKGIMTDPGQPFIAGQYTPGQANTWQIKVSWTVPAHTCCGPCCSHDLPAVNDTWTQKISYDYFDITKATVWKLEQGHINGMKAITGGTDTYLTQILQGNPSIFYNIAKTETSKDGRFRYDVEPQQHDAVVWNKGTRSNKCDKQSESWGTGISYNNNGFPHQSGYLEANSSAKDKATNEYAEFKSNREKLVTATVISDYLILQTSSGDQAVLYYDKKSNTVQTQKDYNSVSLTKAEAWDNNSSSAAKWTPGSIFIGSYNGKFTDVSSKYKGSGNGGRVATVFDNDPAKAITRPARPSIGLQIAKYDIDILNTLPNNQYETGVADVLWEVKLNYNPDNNLQPYDVQAKPMFQNKAGYVLEAPYSPNHSKVNDIVVQDPVSTEYAMVLPLDPNRDQRTKMDKGKAVKLAQAVHHQCPVTPAECEFRELNCRYLGTSYHTAACYSAATPATLNTHDHTIACIDTAKLQEAFKTLSINETYQYTGGVQSFTAPYTGTYTLEAWGAQGGGFPSKTSEGGYGGYSKSIVTLTKGQTIYIYVGGRGGNAPDDSIDKYAGLNSNSGYNGGGNGSGSRGPGGGGRTDIRFSAGTLDVYVVAAGGGGGYQNSGSSNSSSNGSYFQGSNGIVGYAGKWPYDNGGGGGGYYGGNTISGDDPSTGHAGTNYSTGSGSIDSYGVNSGNGKAVITYSSSILIGTTWGLVDMDSILVNGNIKATTAWLAKQQVNAPIYKCGSQPYNRHICNSQCQHTSVLKCNEPHHTGEHYDVSNTVCWKACGDDNKHGQKVSAPAGSAASGKTAGNFLNLDWGFQIYFPNTGDFNQGQAAGIPALTSQRGKGFVDGMDTSEWIDSKRVRFMFDVIYCGTASALNVNGSQHGNASNGSDNHKHIASCKLYRAGSWVDLSDKKEFSLYNFYAIGSNSEAVASKVSFECVAVNAPAQSNDNTQPTNRYRDGSMRSKHGAVKSAYIDIVGRIGNLVVEDTGDYRFSNLFKTPIAGNEPDNYLIQGIVKKVDLNSKNFCLAATEDIRGLNINTVYGQDTYGSQPWIRSKTLTFPLSPDKNNVTALKNQAIRFGYPVYLDINTLGKGYDTIEVIPYYYYYELDTGKVKALDIYMEVGADDYQAINRFGLVKSGWDQSLVYPYKYVLDWTKESGRRNVTSYEAELTQKVVNELSISYADDDGTKNFVLLDSPSGSNYALGTAQILSIGEKARTFIGGERTLGVMQNLGGISEVEFIQAVKRWHFTLGLPSSAVAVDAGAALMEANINKYRNADGVVLMTASIKCSSDKFSLEYKLPSNGSFSLGGRTYQLPSELPNVIAVYNGQKSSKDDLEISKTH